MFSEKYGYMPEKVIQYEKVSDELRNRIWNLFYQHEIKAGGISSKSFTQVLTGEQTMEEKIADKMGLLIDSAGKHKSATEQLKDNVIRFFPWFKIYDFIDIYLSFLEKDERIQRIQQYNEILEQEKAGYRIVAGEVAPITNESEILCIEQATTTPYQSVNQHIQKALALYADIKSPDYENSVKEAISAVEAMCCIITGISGAQATLGAAIKKLKDSNVHIHNAMEKAFLALYGYTSDENGIRHGGIDFTSVPSEDAKYMLVSCSAFVNYLMEKWSKVDAKVGGMHIEKLH